METTNFGVKRHKSRMISVRIPWDSWNYIVDIQDNKPDFSINRIIEDIINDRMMNDENK